MALGKIGTTIGKEIIAWTKTSGSKSLLATKPIKINSYELMYAKNLKGDVVQFSNQNKNFSVVSSNKTNSWLKKNPFYEIFNVFNKKIYLAKNGFPKLNYSTVRKFLRDNPNINLKDFCTYANKINYAKLQNIVPEVKNFKSFNKLHFANHHYKQYKTDFTIEDLQFSKDLTQYLKENYTNADDMIKLYSAFPTISRDVGCLPDDWIKLLNTSSITNNKYLIYNSIDNFRNTKKIKIFEQELSNILGQTVKIKRLGKGSHGTAYKISTDKSKDVCLKIFHNYGVDNRIINTHGQYIELQNGLFANHHSNDFAKVYFGRVGVVGKPDGFMVTQYIENGIEPELAKISKNTSSYKIGITDDHSSNYKIVNGKKIYIDFGGMQINSK